MVVVVSGTREDESTTILAQKCCTPQEKFILKMFMTPCNKHLSFSAVKKINDFCNLPTLTDEQAAEVVEMSAFKTMKQDKKCNYSWLDSVSVGRS